MAMENNLKAYLGLKFIGHNWANEPFNKDHYYVKEWKENEHMLEETEIEKDTTFEEFINKHNHGK